MKSQYPPSLKWPIGTIPFLYKVSQTTTNSSVVRGNVVIPAFSNIALL